MKSGSSLLNNDNKKKDEILPRPPHNRGGLGNAFEEKTHPSELTGAMSEDSLSRRRTVILGIGNILLSDEGIGVHVANELMQKELPPDVSVVEGGTDGFRLLNVITEADRLIVIDAVRGGDKPGTIYRFDINDVRNSPAGFKTSVHQIGILEVIDLSGLIGKTPHTTVIGVEPKSLEMGLELSPEIMEKVPRVLELVLEELNK
jgi:hydrogenase maturation protease